MPALGTRPRAQQLRQARHERAHRFEVGVRGDELERLRVDAPGVPLDDGGDDGRDHGALAQEPEQAVPGGCVQRREHVQGLVRQPRRAGRQVRFERTPERVQAGERVRVADSSAAEDRQ
jgi:hypothetical protein